MSKLLVTGGAGFMGSDFIRRSLTDDQTCEIVNLDLLTYAGNLENLKSVETHDRYSFVRGDIGNAKLLADLFNEHRFHAVIHFAAESHVDRSIEDASVFVRTNVLGTHTLLETIRQNRVARFILISTDEVYGSLGKEGAFTEQTPLAPNSPYSASKAGADMLALAYAHTYDLPIMVTRSSNNYGPFQFPEKFVPLMIINLLQGKKIPVYGDGSNIRDWLYVGDHTAAVRSVLKHGKPGEVYNVGGQCEISNLELAKMVVEEFGASEDSIEFIADRPGHDWRYAIDSNKLRSSLGWKPQSKQIQSAICDVIDWYKENQSWWQSIVDGDYRHYYERQYGPS